MNTARIQSELAGTLFHTVHHFSTIHSTNTHGVEEAHRGAEAGTVYIADEQTAGRGRGGHTWHSKIGDGLYLSALLRPRLSSQESLKISLAAGIAAQTAIEIVTGVRIDIRWPNDLMLNGRKLGGILTESSLANDGTLRFAVTGIGINLNQSAMPPEIENISTSLRIATGKEFSREDLAVQLLRAFSEEIQLLEQDQEAILSTFERASTWAFGKCVTVAEEGGYTGITDGLSATGLLRILCDDGTIREVRHGGVREA